MFLHLSVILFTGGEVYTPGTDTLPGHTPRSHTPGHTHPPGHTHTHPLTHPRTPPTRCRPRIWSKGAPDWHSRAESCEWSELSVAGVQGPLKSCGSFWVFKAQICILPHSRDFFSNFWIEWLEVCQAKQGSKILWHGSWKIDQLCDW